MTRRVVLELLSAVSSARAWTSGVRFRLSVCNETFQNTPFSKQCRMARRIGYSGIEIMPATLAPDAAMLTATRQAEIRRVVKDEGLRFVGLHNLLTGPSGLHATSVDAAVFRRTWDYVRLLVDLCANLGPGGVMVFGSGKQRNAAPGIPISDATARFAEGIAGVAPYAAKRGIVILIEPLAPRLSNIINNLEEAVAIVRQVNNPGVSSMLDVHNTAAETVPADKLVARFFPYIRHVHLNEMDGRRPGLGNYDFKPLLRALAERNYKGWLSLEVFDFSPDGETVAREAFAYIHAVELTVRRLRPDDAVSRT